MVKVTKNRFIVLFFVLAVVVCEASGQEIYHLDFTAPEHGSYETIFGEPTIAASVGPFTDAMVFDAVTTYEQIRLEVGGVGQEYDIQFDALVHNLLDSEYAFSILLDYDADLSSYRRIDFHGGLNRIETFSPGLFEVGTVQGYSNDEVYHFEINLNFNTEAWRLEIDGVERFTGPIRGSNLEAIRFGMSPWIGGAVDDPSAYGVVDNVVVTVVPEPSTAALLVLGGLGLMVFGRRKAGEVGTDTK